MNRDDLLDLRGIADYLGVSPNTPNQWRQRSKKGQMHPPLPEPDFPELAQPLWLKTTITDWAQRAGKPIGSAGRPHMRGRTHEARTRKVVVGARRGGRPRKVTKRNTGFRTAEELRAEIPTVIFQPPPPTVDF